MAFTYEMLQDEYRILWNSMVIVRTSAVIEAVERLAKGFDVYKRLEVRTGVPAYIIAAIHEREASGRFSAYLGNGEAWNRRTTIVPIGRGPFNSFEDGAVDALTIEGLTSVHVWGPERALFYFEKFNGFGYRNRGLRSPYLWGGTNHQQPGKYVRDNVFDPTVMDSQLGAAPLMFGLQARFAGMPVKPQGAPQTPSTPPPLPQPRPTPTLPPAASLGAWFSRILASIAAMFKRS